MSGYFDPSSRSKSLSVHSLVVSLSRQESRAGSSSPSFNSAKRKGRLRSKTASLPNSLSSENLHRVSKKTSLPPVTRQDSFNGVVRYSSQPRRMTNTVRASNKAAILAVGEELRLLLHNEQPAVIKTRRYHLKSYETCFIGLEMVDWLINKGEVESRAEAVAMMQRLLETGVIHHVCDDHDFKDEKLFYRFRKDDGSYEEPTDTLLVAKGQRIYSRLRTDGSNLIQDRKFHLTTYKQCFVAREFVDWLITRNEAATRGEAIDIGRQLLEAGVFKHVCDDHHFKDEFLFFRFRNDEPSKRKTTAGRIKKRVGSILNSTSDDTSSIGEPDNRLSMASYDSSQNSSESINHTGESSTTPPLDENDEMDDYIQMRSSNNVVPPTAGDPGATMDDQQGYVHMQPHMQPPTVQAPQMSSPPSFAKVTLEELLDPSGNYVERTIDVVSDPVGYGFVIRGSNPVYVHTVDPNGPAAATGLQVGEYLHYVNGQQVLDMSHSDVARIILMGTSTAHLVTFIEKDRLKNVDKS